MMDLSGVLSAGAFVLRETFLCAKSAEQRSAIVASTITHAQTTRGGNMEEEQKARYMKAMARAIALVVGPRDADYNKGGIKLRDYWAVNGIKSPIQMVDMKLKRAFSQIGTWGEDDRGHPIPKSWGQVDKLEESMLDLINYAAFVICEAHSLGNESRMPAEVDRDFAQPSINTLTLAQRISEAVALWQGIK